MANETNPTRLAPLPEPVRRNQRRALLTGAVCLALCLVGALLYPRPFFQAYLLGFMLVLGATLGSLAILMLHHLTGGEWGVPIRRILEAITRNTPLVTLMFLPLLAGIGHLYEWSHPDIVSHDEVLKHKAAYLNVPFFIVRAAIYFAVWNLLAFLFNRGSVELDRTRSVDTARRLQQLAGPGILLYVITMTFAAFDWLMSLEPHWYSTIYGVLLVVGQVLSAFALVTIVLARLSEHPPLSKAVGKNHFHDIGNLTLAFVMLWAYMSLSQFLIIYSGNVSEETPWYIARTNHGWGFVALALVLFHFALPFTMLLSRGTKRNYRVLATLAMLILVMRAFDLFWMIAPALANASAHGELADPNARYFHMTLLDVLMPIGLGGLWLAAMIRQLARRPLLPAGLPQDEQGHLSGQQA